MRTRKRTKLVHEGKYVAELDVDLIETDEGWSPYLSLEDAYKLDDVRDALRRGDIEAASRLARIFKLTPVTESIPPEDIFSFPNRVTEGKSPKPDESFTTCPRPRGTSARSPTPKQSGGLTTSILQSGKGEARKPHPNLPISS